MIDEKVINKVLVELCNDGYGCFSSEAQLRDAFAIKIGSIYPNCVVIPEYTKPIPSGWALSEKGNIFFDLLIYDKKDDEHILVEFKYKTAKGTFDCGVGKDINLSDQSDTTNGRYAIWRDIFRIENFANKSEIAKGFLIFITNNHTYYNAPRSTNLDVEFSIEPGMHVASDKSWNITGHSLSSIHSSYLKDVQPLCICNDYNFNYMDYSSIADKKGKVHLFKKLIVPIYGNAKLDKIEKTLCKMGKEVFVEYYDLFRAGDSKICKDELSSKTSYKKNSINTRVSCGINLFKDGMHIEALRNIVASSKVPEAVRDKAKEILTSELGA